MKFQDIKERHIIDIRLPVEWEMTGIIPGSLLLTFFDENANINPKFLPTIKDKFKENDKIALICRTAHRSKFAMKFLQNHGFSDVCDIDGGIFELIRLGVSLKKFEL